MRCFHTPHLRYVREYLKILAIFLAFFVIFSISSSLFYLKANRNEREKIELEAVSGINRQVEQIDGYIQQLYSFSYSFLSNHNDILRTDSYSSKAEQGDNNVLLVKGLRNLRRSVYENIFRIFLYSSSSEYLYYDNGVCPPDMYFDELYRRSSQNRAFWDRVAAQNVQMRILPSTQVYEKYGLTATKNVIPILIPYKAGSKTWLLTLDIDADNLADTAQTGAVLESQTFCCVDAQGTVVYNTGNHQFDKEELSRIGSSSVAGELFILESCRLGDETYFLAGKRGIGDLLYFTMIPLSQIRQTASQLNQSLLFFFLMFLLLFFILAVIYLCQLYHPFRIILRMSSRVETEQAGALLQNPFDRFGQIEAIYQQTEDILEDSFLTQLRLICSSGLMPADGGFQKRFLAKQHLSERDLGCIALKFSFHESYYHDFTPAQQKTIESELSSILADLLQKDVHCLIVPISSWYYLCIFNKKYTISVHFKQLSDFIRNILEYDADYCTVYAGMSQFHSSGDSLFRAMMESLTALCAPQEKITLYQAEETSFSVPFQQKERNQLLLFLKGGEADKITGLLAELEEKCISGRVFYPLYRQLLTQLISIGYEFLQNSEEASAQRFSQYQQALLDLGRDESFPQNGMQAVSKYLLDCSSRAAQAKMPQRNLEEVLTYIRSHLSEDLYLEKIAEAQDLSPKYLSRIFRERMGVTLTSYIGRERVRQAQELLRSTSKNVAEIGREVGFESRTTFFRIFKTETGISPTDYRKMCREHEKGE